MPCRVMIVDDHNHAREGMRDLLSTEPLFELVAEASGGHEAIELAAECVPDLILMDIEMKDMNGLEATKAIKHAQPAVKIVIVTVSDDITDLFEAIKNGAQGYLLKNLLADSWLDYLRAVALDEAPLSRELAHQMLKEFAKAKQSAHADHPLTPREQEVLESVALGLSNRDIAQRLHLSEHTVKNHLKNILQKLHLENRVQLTRYAYERGIVPIRD